VELTRLTDDEEKRYLTSLAKCAKNNDRYTWIRDFIFGEPDDPDQPDLAPNLAAHFSPTSVSF
jgi:hypothetical protein